jgi:hypothetical protein
MSAGHPPTGKTPRRREGWVPPPGQSGAQPPRRRQAVEGKLSS